MITIQINTSTEPPSRDLQSNEPNGPICEICGREPAEAVSFFGDRSVAEKNGRWKLAGACTRDIETYYIEFDTFSARLAQNLTEKSWFDRGDFAAAVGRLIRGR